MSNRVHTGTLRRSSRRLRTELRSVAVNKRVTSEMLTAVQRLVDERERIDSTISTLEALLTNLGVKPNRRKAPASKPRSKQTRRKRAATR